MNKEKYHDYLTNIPEKDMKAFLERELGVPVEFIAKYYDGDYGNMFKVTLHQFHPAFRNLPTFDVYLGKFGLVKDDETTLLFRKINDFSLAETDPEFFLAYIKFVNRYNIPENGMPIENVTYMDDFKFHFNWYISSEKKKAVEQAEKVANGRKSLRDRIIENSEPESAEPGEE